MQKRIFSFKEVFGLPMRLQSGFSYLEQRLKSTATGRPATEVIPGTLAVVYLQEGETIEIMQRISKF